MKQHKKVPWKNKSPYGWWLASYIIRFGYVGKVSGPRAKCTAWENTVLIRGKTREIAYEKTVVAGKLACGKKYRAGNPPGPMAQWIFEGLTSLLPIYEQLEDGAEIFWQDHSGISVKNLRSHLKAKSELEAFDESAN